MSEQHQSEQHNPAPNPAQIFKAAAAEINCSCDQLEILCRIIHSLNKNWWIDLETNEPIKRNIPEMIALMHSELSEGLEGFRKNLQDDHLPHRKMLEVEMADLFIRLGDFCGGLKLDLAGAVYDKLQYNTTRADHKRDARLAADGKKI